MLVGVMEAAEKVLRLSGLCSRTLKLLLCFLFTFLSSGFHIYSYFVHLCCTYSYFVVNSATCIAQSTLQRSLSKEMGYTPNFFIENVSVKLPCKAFAILRKSWEMIMNPDVGVFRRLLTIIAYCLINQRLQNVLERDWNLSFVNILRASLKQRMFWLYEWFLQYVFNVSILLFSQVPTLQCKQAQTSLKNYNSGLGFWSPRRSLISDPLRNRNPCLGRNPYYGNHWFIRLNVFQSVDLYHLIAYFTSRRCKVRCADESRGTRWDGQKTKLSPSAEMLKSTPLVQRPAVNCRQLCQLALQNKKGSCSFTTQLSLYSNFKITA